MMRVLKWLCHKLLLKVERFYVKAVKLIIKQPALIVHVVLSVILLVCKLAQIVQSLAVRTWIVPLPVIMQMEHMEHQHLVVPQSTIIHGCGKEPLLLLKLDVVKQQANFAHALRIVQRRQTSVGRLLAFVHQVRYLLTCQLKSVATRARAIFKEHLLWAVKVAVQEQASA